MGAPSLLFAAGILEQPFDWLNLLIWIAIVVVGWTALKFLFRLTIKLFTLGCLGIVLVGLVWAAVTYFGGA